MIERIALQPLVIVMRNADEHSEIGPVLEIENEDVVREFDEAHADRFERVPAAEALGRAHVDVGRVGVIGAIAGAAHGQAIGSRL